jgi:A/G-specific adenine glycosylase
MLHTPLLEWYDTNHRQLPWRANPGQLPNPYHVLLSEVMLQQTTVGTVVDFFLRFIHLWPTLQDLAAASLEEVYHAWQGLGYYSRAKNLHACVRQIVDLYQGEIPSTLKELLALPGIGPYTAAAIGAIAYELPVVPVDGNIVRVFSRVLGLETPLPALKNEIFERVKDHVPPERRGDFAQALMDLGATVCKPRSPLCQNCPLQHLCQAHAQNLIHRIPMKGEKPLKPRRYGFVYWYESPQGKVAIRRRPPKGLLANLMEVPGTEWNETSMDLEEALRQAPPSEVPWVLLPTKVRHTFTHFHLDLQILKGTGEELFGDFACPFEELSQHAFSTLMRKVITLCRGEVPSL